MNKKVFAIGALFIAIAAIILFVLPGRGKELTESNFPKQVEGYKLVDLKADDTTDKASGAFLGVKENLKKTFLANYKASGGVVTLWVLVPKDASKEIVIAQQLAENMTKQGGMFENFNTITVNEKPVVTFTGPMKQMEHYIFYKDGKVFWASIVTKGNARQAFDIFYNKF